MKRCTLAGVVIAACLLAPVRTSAAPLANDVASVNSVADDTTLFRLFLKDGTTLVSYGEFARVGDRVVFSMPTSALDGNPALHVVNLAADRVDWERTKRYAESARATRYITTQAELDYASISNDVARTLNDVAVAPDNARRLALVESARKALADWPRNHFNYRAGEVRQMVTLLDEAIADLRAKSAPGRFDLSLTAFAGESPVLEPLLPPPTLKDAIQQTLLAARLSESAVEREALFDAALASLDRGSAALPAEWAKTTRAETTAALRVERQVDRTYQLLSLGMLAQGQQRARRADVRGVEQVLASIRRRDTWLGQKRPDEIHALVTAVETQLDAARVLRLARDRWAMRAPEFRKYHAAISAPVDLLAVVARLKPALEDIKALAGSPPAALAAIGRAAAEIIARAAAIVPPEELRAAHALLVSAAQMADHAARIRREAALSENMARAWDASSAAAGALMLAARAKSEIQMALRPPELR
jgi:hypothetical protein